MMTLLNKILNLYKIDHKGRGFKQCQNGGDVTILALEYSDLSSKYQMVLQMLESEQQQRTLDKDAFLEKEKHMKCELEALRKSYSELSVSSVAEPSTTAGQEEKLEKLKTGMYLSRYIITYTIQKLIGPAFR